jgi:PAS domain S-box-containing protein
MLSYKYSCQRLFFIIFFVSVNFAVSSVFANQTSEPPSSQHRYLDSIQKVKIDLSKEERAFLKAHPVIRFGTDETWAPYVTKGADGELEGFDVDLLHYINATTGANIQLVTGQWSDMVKKAKAHEIDGLATSAPLEVRAPYFNFSDIYVSEFPLIIVRSETHLDITQLGDLAGKTLAIQRGNEFYTSLLKPYPDIKIIETDSETKSAAMLVEGRADAALSSTTSYNDQFKKFFKSIKIAHVMSGSSLDVVYSIRKDWPELRPIINKALAALPVEIKNYVFSRWFGFNSTLLPVDKEVERIPLTTEEQIWIKEHSEIRLGVDPTWQPLEFVDKKGKHQGISSDYVRILNNRLGLNMKIVPNLSWPQVMESVPQRGIDVLPAVTKTPEREKHLSYSVPYTYINWVIISRTDTPEINSLADLEGRVTAVNAGYASQDHMKEEYLGVPLLPESSTLDVLQSVVDGKAEAAVVELNAATLVIHGHRIKSLKVDQHVFKKHDPLAIAVRNDWPELVQILNKGLASITPDERERIDQKWLAVPIKIGFTKMDMLRIIFFVIVVMSLFVVFFMIWNRRLHKEVHERIMADEKLKKSEEQFRLLIENAPDAVFVRNKSCFTYLNKAALGLFGADSEQDLIGTPIIEHYHPKVRDDIRERMRIINEERLPIPQYQSVCLKLDGTEVCVESTAVPITYQGEDGGLIFLRNTTDRVEDQRRHQQLEEQLHQSQKIESLGRLAGGVAHDYNNMLSVILGYSELAQMKVNSSNPIQSDLDQIIRAANRSRDITRQLLAFARKQIINPEVLDLNTSVENTLKMLRTLLGENIDLVWHPKGDLWPVKIDPSQLDQVLANICVNARDAIADVGKMIIETDVVTFDKDYASDHPGFVPGDFTVLAISDSGCGMDRDTVNNIFEPFYTTKGVGEGTGLGLSTVYGIVKQSNGFIDVYSELNQGTTFKIYLPRCTEKVVLGQESPISKIQKGHGEKILLVEDESAIVEMTTTMLKDFGYKVLAANSPAEALDLAKSSQGEIHLLLTDVVMPGMNGRDLANQLKNTHPNLQVTYMSGYTADVIAHHGVLDDGVNFIQKPFSRTDLSIRIREVLDSKS